MSETFTGGCQCGAVRFAVDAPLGRASICHCRMCQKAGGGVFGAFVSGGNLRWTRGAPAHFQSSNKVARGFCAACGTPLTFEWNARTIQLAIGAFDEPARIPPAIQLDSPSRMPWFADLHGLPSRAEDEAPWQAELVSYQHPDHDTDAWPPADGGA
ncbi:MAG TPA: GFA family protein [Caulobacteraceae bacterium]|jgi:hypothetical protein|nr:GFA family protein [Caulobacteraceae bacterium]